MVSKQSIVGATHYYFFHKPSAQKNHQNNSNILLINDSANNDCFDPNFSFLVQFWFKKVTAHKMSQHRKTWQWRLRAPRRG